MMLLGYILWDEHTDEPCRRPAPTQWDGRPRYKPTVIYDSQSRASNEALKWCCGTKAVWVYRQPE
jgi:hypothetical protein